MKLIKINEEHYLVVDDSGKYILDTKQNLSLQEVKELIGEVDVEKKAELLYPKTINPNSILQLGGYRQAYIEGYNQALEDNKEKKYTEEDIRKAFYYGGKSVIDEYGTFEDYIKSLNKQD